MIHEMGYPPVDSLVVCQQLHCQDMWATQMSIQQEYISWAGSQQTPSPGSWFRSKVPQKVVSDISQKEENKHLSMLSSVKPMTTTAPVIPFPFQKDHILQ